MQCMGEFVKCNDPGMRVYALMSFCSMSVILQCAGISADQDVALLKVGCSSDHHI